jgi:hypothetical protein
MIKQLLNSVLAKYRDLWRWLADQLFLIDLLATDKSRYFAQPRPIIDNYFFYSSTRSTKNYLH